MVKCAFQPLDLMLNVPHQIGLSECKSKSGLIFFPSILSSQLEHDSVESQDSVNVSC